MKANLLIEVLCEELPAIPFLKEEPNILAKWQMILKEYQLEASFEFYYTPRRLVLISRDFPLKQNDRQIEFFGPPVGIAYIQGDPSKGLSKAGESFLQKCKISQAKTAQKDGKEVLYWSESVAGAESESVLGEMIGKWIASLQFGKSMRWGALQDSFIRPIRSVVALLGSKSVEFELFGVRSGDFTYVHRDCGFEPKSFGDLESYLNILKEGGVILDPKERKAKILKEINQIQAQKNVEIELDEELLAEIIAITESPKALYGSFDQEFLELPREVIVTSMKENQRYFALYQDQKLHNGFVVITNSVNGDDALIVKGNEKVLRARLSDAMFFYRNDLKRALLDYDLSKIAFVEGLGSMAEKVEREKEIASFLSKGDQEVLEAQQISKSDLLSEMVGEFPELQGVMGEYYALHEMTLNLPYRNAKIARALREQYMPNGEDDEIPSSQMGAYLALSYRLDLLLALFSIGKIPSGSKDPYGLRRSGNAILKILQVHPIALSLESLEILAKHYKDFDVLKVWEFLLERMEGVLKLNPSILRSVIKGKEKDLAKMMAKSIALAEVFEEEDKDLILSTFKRVANITKEIPKTQKIDPALFQEAQEHTLYEAIQHIQSEPRVDLKSYIKSLFSLKAPLEEFFERVMVNVEDEQIRENRKMLIYQIYEMFLEIGDIKEITG
ncbi:glycine--tRNA ligase subunit beta [Helicobacter pametensis]|uniref:glycine--tRNA ligase subunit beta n=1 Tax=Helicobacter pametensis TaxID=95149 RepID=UPI0004876459|nr:glycine--tRNA ligase subunit beta [Helicobacter pametensis]